MKTSQVVIIALAVVLVIGSIVGAVTYSKQQKQQTYRICLRQEKPPLECRAAFK